MFPVQDTVPTRHPAVMVWALIAINVAVFLLELTLGPRLEPFFYLFGLVPARFSHPAWALRLGLPIHEYWPFLTSMFLHAGWLHVIGNMWFLWIFGDNVEDRMGSGRFLAFYLLCGVAAGAVQWLTNPSSTVPTVGASGAIAGVLGAYLVLFPRARVLVVIPLFFWPFFFDVSAFFFLGFWFLIQLFSGTLALAGPEHVGGVAFWAHVGGFGTGVLLHRLFLEAGRRGPGPDELGVESAWARPGP